MVSPRLNTTLTQLPRTPTQAGLIGVNLKRKKEFKNSHQSQTYHDSHETEYCVRMERFLFVFIPILRIISNIFVDLGILNDRFGPFMIFTYFDIWHQAQCIVMCVVQCPRS